MLETEFHLMWKIYPRHRMEKERRLFCRCHSACRNKANLRL